MMTPKFKFPAIETYDGIIDNLYLRYIILLNICAITAGLKKLYVHCRYFFLGKYVDLPVFCFRTKHTGHANYIISGIHGREPSGPCALSSPDGIELLLKLSESQPVVLYPLCNPAGYVKNWQYPDRKQCTCEPSQFQSIGASEYHLPQVNKYGMPLKRRCKEKPSKEAILFTSHVLSMTKKNPPKFTISFHDDDRTIAGYAYSHGILKKEDPAAINIVRILVKLGLSYFKMDLNSQFIGKEWVITRPCDYSVESLLASDKILVRNRHRKLVFAKGPSCKSVVVCETPSAKYGIEHRINAILSVLSALEDGSLFVIR